MRTPLFLLLKNTVNRLPAKLRRLSKFKPIRIIYDFIFQKLRPEMAEVDGHKMFLDLRDKAISHNLLLDGYYEKFGTEVFKREIKKGMTVLDCGANIGYYTLIAASIVGEKGKVYAFEPGPDNFALLKKNVEINGYKNIVLVQKAISNETKKIKLFLSQDNKGTHRTYNSFDGRESVVIDAIALDEYFKNHKGQIDFIKMDIEGSEARALQGMINILMKNKQIKILTEFSPTAIKVSGYSPEEHLNNLAKLGFKLYDLNELEEKIEPIKNINNYTKKCYVDKNGGKTGDRNLLCLR